MKVTKGMKWEIERRLNNWAMDRARLDHGIDCNIAPGFEMFVSSHVRESSRMPMLPAEAQETEGVMRELLAPALKQMHEALMIQYVWRPPVHQRYVRLNLRASSYYRLVDAAVAEFFRRLKADRAKQVVALSA